MSRLSKIADTIQPIKKVRQQINGKDYWVNYIDGKKLSQSDFYLFGFTYKGNIYVLTGLPGSVERYILRHEAYHVLDTHAWLGRYGQEIRANIYAGARDPFGFFMTLAYSLNGNRIKTHWRLYVRS